MQDVYKSTVSGPAWDTYYIQKAQGVKGAFDKTVGKVPAMTGMQLIPAILNVYATKGWTAASLRYALAGIIFPPLADQQSMTTTPQPALAPVSWGGIGAPQPQFAPPGSGPTVAPAWKP